MGAARNWGTRVPQFSGEPSNSYDGDNRAATEGYGRANRSLMSRYADLRVEKCNPSCNDRPATDRKVGRARTDVLAICAMGSPNDAKKVCRILQTLSLFGWRSGWRSERDPMKHAETNLDTRPVSHQLFATRSDASLHLGKEEVTGSNPVVGFKC
jgi:hypothetical protein